MKEYAKYRFILYALMLVGMIAVYVALGLIGVKWYIYLGTSIVFALVSVFTFGSVEAYFGKYDEILDEDDLSEEYYERTK